MRVKEGGAVSHSGWERRAGLTRGDWQLGRGTSHSQSSQWDPEFGRQSPVEHQSGSKIRESLSLIMYPTWDERTSKKKVREGENKRWKRSEVNLWIIGVFGPYNEIKIKAS